MNKDLSDRGNSAWDIRNAPKNYLFLAAYQVGSSLFSFATVLIITRQIGSTGYGSLIAVIAASQIVQVFVNWSSAAVVRFGTEEFIDTGVIARAFWTRFIVLAVNSAIVLSLGGYWFTVLADWLKLSPSTFWLVIWHFIVTVLWIQVQMALQGAKLQRTQGLLQMVERVAIFSSVVLLLFLGSIGYFNVMICYIAAPAIMAVVGIIHIRGLIFRPFTIDTKFLRKVLTYSLPLLPFSLIGYFSGSFFDSIFIAKLLSIRDLGTYAVATQMNGIALQFPTLATALLTPFFISLDKEGALQKVNSYFYNALPNLTLACGFIGTITSLAGYFIIPTLFGIEFQDAAIPFSILITSTVLAIPVLCGYAALTHARSVTYIAAIAATASALINIAFNFLLIPRYGMAGCAWATVCAYMTSSLGFAILLRVKEGMPVSWVFLAILPNLIGTLTFALTGNVWIAAAVGIGLFILVLGLRRRSIGDGIDIISRILRT